MKIVAAQWNIQAAKVLRKGANPRKSSNYEGDDPQYFAEVLRKYNPDIITLQEVHSNDNRDQAKEIANMLGLEHVRTDVYEEKSFMDDSYSLGQAIIARYPLLRTKYTTVEYSQFDFPSPYDPEDTWTTRDNGITSGVVELADQSITIATTHLVPFRFFGLDPWADKGSALELRENFVASIKQLEAPWLLMGDMNVNTSRFSKYLGEVANDPRFKEVEQSVGTNPHGQILDHVALHGLKISSNNVDTSVKADHYLVITELVF